MRRVAQLDDSELERAINLSHRQLVLARDLPNKAAAWRVLCRLIKARSPEAIARMERERGLAKAS
jgi:hypothetical protein